VFSKVDLSQVPVFLHMAEQERPPWRLVECTLASSRQADGLGRVVLILEAAGKSGSGANKQTPNIERPTSNAE